MELVLKKVKQRMGFADGKYLVMFNGLEPSEPGSSQRAVELPADPSEILHTKFRIGQKDGIYHRTGAAVCTSSNREVFATDNRL